VGVAADGWVIALGTAVCHGGGVSGSDVPVMEPDLYDGKLWPCFLPEWGHWFMAAGIGRFADLLGLLSQRRHGG